MSVLRYGDRGEPVLYLPTSGGDEREFERYEMPDVAEPWIAAGRLQFFSVNAGGPTSLFNDALSPAERMRRYVEHERHVADEVLPWIRDEFGYPRLTVVGASYGAFMGANLLFKHPEQIEMLCGLGGVYGMWHRLDGYHDDSVYSHTPLEYLPNLEDERILAAIRETGGVALYAAENDEWLSSTQRLCDVLHRKRLPHTISVWPAPADHHERWWRRQLRLFLETRWPLS